MRIAQAAAGAQELIKLIFRQGSATNGFGGFAGYDFTLVAMTIGAFVFGVRTATARKVIGTGGGCRCCRGLGLRSWLGAAYASRLRNLIFRMRLKIVFGDRHCRDGRCIVI